LSIIGTGLEETHVVSGSGREAIALDCNHYFFECISLFFFFRVSQTTLTFMPVLTM